MLPSCGGEGRPVAPIVSHPVDYAGFSAGRADPPPGPNATTNAHERWPRTMRKVFILGVGAQRSGTTWLYNYLHHHPNVDLGFAKEYHIFDVLYLADEGVRRRFLQHRINNVFSDAQDHSRARDIRLLRFLGDTDLYFDYFMTLVNSDASLIATGDITPSYSSLPVEALRRIKTEVNKRSMEIKVIFLMRDPVDRCISAARQRLQRSLRNWSQEEELSILRHSYSTAGDQLRTRYDLTIRNLDSVFDASEVGLFFYEDFFNTASIGRLNQYAGLQFGIPKFDEVLNASGKNHDIDESIRRDIFIHYSEVYRFIADRFGADYVRSIWDGYSRFSAELR